MKRQTVIDDETSIGTFCMSFADSKSKFSISTLPKYWSISLFFLVYGSKRKAEPFFLTSSCDLYFHSVCKNFNTIESSLSLRSRFIRIFQELSVSPRRKFPSSKSFWAFLRQSSFPYDCVWIFMEMEEFSLKLTYTHTLERQAPTQRQEIGKILQVSCGVLEWGRMPDGGKAEMSSFSKKWRIISQLILKYNWLLFFIGRSERGGSGSPLNSTTFITPKCRLQSFRLFPDEKFINYHKIINFLYLPRTKM